jgi:hypothetical protein
MSFMNSQDKRVSGIFVNSNKNVSSVEGLNRRNILNRLAAVAGTLAAR